MIVTSTILTILALIKLVQSIKEYKATKKHFNNIKV